MIDTQFASRGPLNSSFNRPAIRSERPASKMAVGSHLDTIGVSPRHAYGAIQPQAFGPVPTPPATRLAQVQEPSGPDRLERPLKPEDIYVWLDLGNVLLDTRDPAGTKFMPEALNYLHDLREKGFKIGLITNIPAEWGTPGSYSSKIAALQDYIRKTWIDEHPPIDLKYFDEVFLPVYDWQRKPALELFRQAMVKTHNLGRYAIYQGETEAEIVAARDAGMAGFVVRYRAKDPVYLPTGDIPNYVEQSGAGKSSLPENC